MKRTTLFLLSALLLAIYAPVRGQDAKLNALQTAVKANQGDANAHFNLGVEYLNRQNYELAIPELERAVKLNSKDQQAKELLAVARGIQVYMQKDYGKASEYFQETLELNPQNPNANQLLANCYLYQKQYDKAEKAYQDYKAAFPKDREAVKIANQNLAKLYIDQKRYPEALTALKGQVAVDPNSFDAYNNMGVVYFYLKDHTNAALSWEKALKIKKSAQTFKFLGFSYYNLGNYAKAISNYESSLKLDKSDYELYYNLAVAYYDNSLYDKAVNAFASAFKLNPEDSNAATGQAQAIEAAINSHMEKGSNLYLNNEYSKAVAEWQTVLKYQSDHKEAKAFIGDARAKLKEEVDNHISDGKAFAKQGKNVDALRELNLALAMDPENAEAKSTIAQLKVLRSEKVGSYLEQGDDYLAAKDYAAAIAKYRSALKTNPEDATAKARVAKAAAAQKADLNRAMELGRKAAAAKDFKRAIQRFEEARRIAPGKDSVAAGDLLFQTKAKMRSSIKSLLEEGETLFAQGNKEKAREKFMAVAALDQENETANNYIRKLTGQQSQAKVDSEKVKALYYDGVNLYINGKIHEAIGRWKDCLKLDPNYSNAQKNIDKAYVKLQSIQKVGQN